MARGLAALGVRVRELEDGIEIEGGGASSGSVRSHGDHRVAMAFAMAGSRVPVEVHDVANVATSFPGFEAAAATIGLTLDRLDGGT
jgi:5-enolpyruvylshikimate-3-phosphate synthase